MRQLSNTPGQMMTVSILVLATSLSGCASLQGAWGDLKSGSVTTPDEMSKALYLPEPCLLYTSPSPRDQRGSRMPSSA